MKPENRIKKKLCSYVGADYKEIDWENTADPYYWKYTWTNEQEEDFKNWLADYLYSSKQARMIYRTPPRNKKQCKECAYWFTWNHGWKTSE